jgi:hypothetical protein
MAGAVCLGFELRAMDGGVVKAWLAFFPRQFKGSGENCRQGVRVEIRGRFLTVPINHSGGGKSRKNRRTA